jgi:predicted Ser/Thr protein kinase
MDIEKPSWNEASGEDSLALADMVERFEDAWQQGPAPNLDSFLPDDEARHLPALIRLVHVDLEYRLKAGEAMRVETYLRRYPQLARDPSTVPSLALVEYTLRRRREGRLTIDEYTHRFPAFRVEILARLGMEAPSKETVTKAAFEPTQVVRAEATGLSPSNRTAQGPWPHVEGYEILGELGRGGMGVVYKARQLSVGRFVALKMILLDEDTQAAERGRFRREAESLARLQHPNIVRIYTTGEYDGQPFLVMELIEGPRLKGLFNGGPWPVREAARLLETLARAVHVAHQHGIVHRDLTPANVLLDGDCVAKITDFGLVKDLEADSMVTPSGAVLGTPAYMAPEQAEGKPAEAGPATDVYGLGALLYDLLTGRPPFQSTTALDTILQVISTKPVPPSRRQGQIPPDLENICLACLEKKPARRYASAEALADDLRRFLAGERPALRPGGLRCRLFGKVRPLQKVAWTLAGGGAMILALVLLVAFWHPGRPVAGNGAGQLLGTEGSEEKPLSAPVGVKEAEGPPNAPPDNQAAAQGQGSPTRFSLEHGAKVLGISFAPDGNRLVSAGADGVICTWSRATGNRLTRLEATKNMPVKAATFSADGSVLALAGEKKSLLLVDPNTGKELAPLPDWQQPVDALALSPNGMTLYCAGSPGALGLWATRTGVRVPSHLLPAAGVNQAVFSPDGRWLALGKKGAMTLWDVAHDELRGVLPLGGETIQCLAFSPDSNLLAVANTNGSIHLCETSTAKPWASFVGGEKWPRTVAFAPDGQTLAVGGEELRFWNLSTQKELEHRQLPLEETVCCLAFAGDGKALAAGTVGKSALLWRTADRDNVRQAETASASREKIEAGWVELADEDPQRVYRALWALAAAPRQSIPFLRERLHPVAHPPERVSALVAALGHKEFTEREKAAAELARLGPAAEAALRQAFRDHPSRTVYHRVEDLLQPLDRLDGESLRWQRSVQVLEYADDPEARNLLEQLARGAPGARLTEQARAAVERLRKRTELSGT